MKGWCYYEGRLLGAHYGLISTYALETLVLYVFNKYHSKISSPLEVRRAVDELPAAGDAQSICGCGMV